MRRILRFFFPFFFFFRNKFLFTNLEEIYSFYSLKNYVLLINLLTLFLRDIKNVSEIELNTTNIVMKFLFAN